MKSIRLLKIIGINLATFAVLLVALNWVCGIYLKKATAVHRDELPNYSADRAHAKEIFYDYGRVQHRYEPFAGWKMLPYKGKTLQVADDGRRITPVAHAGSEASKKEKAVRFFGGSTMWGEGADDDHTIPALFQASNPEYDVHNHAQLAYNSRQELDELISTCTKNEKLDIVIFYDGVNDAAFLCPSEIRQLPAHRLVPMYREQLYQGKSAMVKELVAKVFFENTLKAIRRITYKPDPEHPAYDCVQNPEKAEQIAEIMMQNWEIAHELVTSRNGRFIAVLQPAAFIGKPKTDHLKLDAELGENFKAIYAKLQQKIAERKHPWIYDLSDRFDGDEYIYIDFCHVSPNGNEIIAREISAIVNQLESQHVAVSLLHP